MKIVQIKSLSILAIGIILMFPVRMYGLEKRMRNTGLFHVLSTSTPGNRNLSLDLNGRIFLWDNSGGQKPKVVPNMEFHYGLWDWVEITGGFQMQQIRPAFLFTKLKLTTPDNKNIRYIGFGVSGELYKNLLEQFPSSLVGQWFGFTKEEFFKATEEEKKDIEVKF